MNESLGDDSQQEMTREVITVACRFVPYEKWLVTQIDAAWTVAEVKEWLLSKCVVNELYTPNDSSYTNVPPPYLASEEEIDAVAYEDDIANEVLDPASHLTISKSTYLPSLFTLIQLSTGQILDEHCSIVDYELEPYELIDIHHQEVAMRLPRELSPKPILEDWMVMSLWVVLRERRPGKSHLEPAGRTQVFAGRLVKALTSSSADFPPGQPGPPFRSQSKDTEQDLHTTGTATSTRHDPEASPVSGGASSTPNNGSDADGGCRRRRKDRKSEWRERRLIVKHGVLHISTASSETTQLVATQLLPLYLLTEVQGVEHLGCARAANARIPFSLSERIICAKFNGRMHHRGIGGSSVLLPNARPNTETGHHTSGTVLRDEGGTRPSVSGDVTEDVTRRAKPNLRLGRGSSGPSIGNPEEPDPGSEWIVFEFGDDIAFQSFLRVIYRHAPHVIGSSSLFIQMVQLLTPTSAGLSPASSSTTSSSSADRSTLHTPPHSDRSSVHSQSSQNPNIDHAVVGDGQYRHRQSSPNSSVNNIRAANLVRDPVSPQDSGDYEISHELDDGWDSWSMILQAYSDTDEGEISERRQDLLLDPSCVNDADDLRVLFELEDQKQSPDVIVFRQRLLELNLDSVQRIMQLLQSELDRDAYSFDVERGSYREKCLRLLRQLSRTHHALPYSLTVQNVERQGNNPVAGGGFADIWRGTVAGKPACLKVLRLIMEQDDEARSKLRQQFCHEALVWRQLRHPNILPLLGVNSELFAPSFCLISPWMDNNDIITYLKKNPYHDLRCVLSDIAAGMCYLHSRDPPLIHGDIRGANILVTPDLRCCLADFGLTLITANSGVWTAGTTSLGTKGAIRWMAPELIIGKEKDPPSMLENTSRDVYAFGCTTVEILTLKPPFHDKKGDAAVLLGLMSGERPPRPRDVWCPDTVWELISRCWAEESAARPKPHEIYDILQALM